MSNMEEIIAEVEDKLSIDSTKLDSEALRNAKVYSNVFRIYVRESKRLQKLKVEKYQIYLERWKRYTNKQTDQHYKNEPLDITILKTDVDKYLKSDPIVVDIECRITDQDLIIQYLEGALKHAMNRSYDIKNSIAFKELTQS